MQNLYYTDNVNHNNMARYNNVQLALLSVNNILIADVENKYNNIKDKKLAIEIVYINIVSYIDDNIVYVFGCKNPNLQLKFLSYFGIDIFDVSVYAIHAIGNLPCSLYAPTNRLFVKDRGMLSFMCGFDGIVMIVDCDKYKWIKDFIFFDMNRGRVVDIKLKKLWKACFKRKRECVELSDSGSDSDVTYKHNKPIDLLK